MRLLVLVTDAYGGRGGIAQYNRDMIAALCAHPLVSEVVAIPRVVVEEVGIVPKNLDFRRDGARGKAAYLRAFMRAILPVDERIAGHGDGRYQAVICGHIHLLPLAYVAARLFRIPLTLVAYGVEVWQPSDHFLANRIAPRIDYFVSISDFTKRRLMQWTGLRSEQGFVVPPSIDVSEFGIGEKRADLVRRYNLEGKTVMLTLGRLAGAERYKGFDEVIELLPELSQEIPHISYLIAGDGPDRHRLQVKADKLGVGEHVVFTGYVSEAEKADHYRLADAYVMPGRGEGFGIVYLEALACGIPVIASLADASREAVRGGLLGQVVDPDQPAEIKAAIHLALGSAHCLQEGLSFFSFDRFLSRWHAALNRALHLAACPAPASSGRD